jgi:hypothetical protein
MALRSNQLAMINRSLLALTSGVALLSSATAQDPRFAAPVLLKAGDKNCGQGRLYPSPVSYDLVRDGRPDVVVGDLRGHLTVAAQRADGTFAAEQKVKDVDGKVLDFGNW